MSGLKAQAIISPKEKSNSALPAQRRRPPRPFSFHMGPVPLCISCVLLVSLMAVLYLSQVSQVVTANHQLQSIRNEQAALERQNQDLVAILTQEQSPAFIIEQAQKMGLRPTDPKDLWVIPVAHWQGIDKAD